MDDRGSVEAMNDSALEREIEAALAVDPSPEFVVRVRSRVSSAPAATVGQWRWGFVVAGLAVTVIVSVWIGSVPTTTSMGPLAASSLTEYFIGAPTSDDSAQISGVVSDAPRLGIGRAVASMAPAFPEVIISPDEVRAFHAWQDTGGGNLVQWAYP